MQPPVLPDLICYWGQIRLFNICEMLKSGI